jgi:putative membrane protein
MHITPEETMTVNRVLAPFAVLALVLTIAGAAAAQSRPASVSAADQQFMTQAAAGGLAEVELSRLAVHRADSDAVRQFGDRMMRDHGAADAELQRLAEQKGVSLPQELDATHRAAYDRLSTMSGPEFDQAYMTQMMSDHAEAVRLFQRETQAGEDREVRAWAAAKLPTLEAHAQAAQQIHAQVAQGAAGSPAAAVASPLAVAVIPPAMATVPVWCGGAWRPDGGTNFASCVSK